MTLPLEQMKAFIVDKTRSNAVAIGDKLPASTVDGLFQFRENGGWVGSFWTGLNYLCYELSGDETFIEVARRSRHRFTKRLYQNPETLDHDIGFLYSLSSVADHKLTGDAEARQVAIDAAKALAGRYHEAGRFINAWPVWHPGEEFSEGNRGRIIVDCMYNLPLLFWAAETTGDARFRNIAEAHADTSAHTLVRPDYSCFHTYLFDPETGVRLRGTTFQGYADDSIWSRGQSWALGGFTYAYRYTGNKLFLDRAVGCAKLFIRELEADSVPMWDFRLPSKEGEPRDTSAGAIAAAGLLELAQLAEPDDAALFRAAAERIVGSLFAHYATVGAPEEQGLLREATGFRSRHVEVNVSLIYGDYYFAEAVARLLGRTKAYW
ncbi:glycoside hydrolase family 88 protein [Paenibacillus cymbidii]|uniref:glycoside hydrolase family 88 protein n=1 Tax=Paenibacillus cymbidii TaxID=1639034 RepID=UPI001081F56F|nr:glycoside hydrolase family 88 protein [Paenibacillus cymbidii]